MTRQTVQKLLTLLSIFVVLWLSLRYLLPMIFPVLLGAGVALGADPLVRFCQQRLRLPRAAATGIGITMALCLLFAVLILLAALLIRELGVLSGILPELAGTAQQGLSLLQGWLLGFAGRAPAGLSPVLTEAVESLFSGGSAFLNRLTQWFLGIASGILGMIPDGMLGLGTAVLAAFMVSAKLPRLRASLKTRLPEAWRSRYLPVLQELKQAVFGWLKAQCKLAGTTFFIVTGGFILLGIPYAPLWAFLVALVDAIPLLGTGTALIPWSIVSFLQGDRIRCLGLLGIYAAAALTRSALEPRLVGRQLGLDPLITLAALYAGYRLWGIGGMLLSPLITVLAVQISRSTAS